MENIAQFEFISWILSQCASLVEVRELLDRINIVNTPFSEQLPLAQLHWIISDENESITVESMSDGLHIYDNPVGVLTNNPPFPQQMFQLNNYMYLSPKQPENTFCENLALDAYSRGMGGLGLPGDLSSSSRFVRVAFTKVMQFQVNQRQKVLVSSSIFLDLWISNVDVVRWLMENVKSLCIRLVVMWQKVSIIIILMKIIRSVQ